VLQIKGLFTLVGARGFEPPTPRAQGRRSTCAGGFTPDSAPYLGAGALETSTGRTKKLKHLQARTEAEPMNLNRLAGHLRDRQAFLS